MEANVTCPNCERDIPIDDVNIATDLALCRGCGQVHSYSLLRETVVILNRSLDQMPRHIRLEEGGFDGAVITYKRIPGAVLFLIPFTAFWSGLSMWGLYIEPLMKGKMEPGKFFFGLPFLLGTLILLSIIAMALFGKWVITLHEGQGKVFVGIGPVGWKRFFSYDQNTQISMRWSNVKRNKQPLKAILIRNGDQEMMFGSTIEEDCKTYIAAYIAEHIRIDGRSRL